MHGSGWMWPMGGMMAGWLVLIVALGVVGLTASQFRPEGAADTIGTARRILAERYARGELDTEEYEQRLNALR